MTEAQLQLQLALRLLQEQMVSRLWTPLTGPRTKLSTRDSNYGQKRLDSPLMPWKVTQKRLRFPTSITVLMEREWDILSHGKKTLICQSAYDELDEDEKEGKYSSESIESYFALFELLLAPSQIHCWL